MTRPKGPARAAIDIGVVTTAPEAMVAFYRDVLGLNPIGRLPTAGGSTVEQLAWGTSLLKIVTLASEPPVRAVPGGVPAATGYRYVTLQVDDLEGVVERCIAAGVPVVVPATTIPDGSTIAIVADPDGNWVEIMREAAAR